MTMVGNDLSVLINAFCPSSEKRASSAPMSPAGRVCLDIFSPPPGDSDVISQVERLSSIETKIAPRSLRMAPDVSRRSDITCMVVSRVGWLQPHSARAPVAIHRPMGSEQSGGELSSTYQAARTDHEAIQISPAGATVSVGSRSSRKPLPHPFPRIHHC